MTTVSIKIHHVSNSSSSSLEPPTNGFEVVWLWGRKSRYISHYQCGRTSGCPVEPRLRLFRSCLCAANQKGLDVMQRLLWKFTVLREENPEKFYNQFMNKVLYAREGARSIMDRTFADFPWQVRVEAFVQKKAAEVPLGHAAATVADVLQNAETSHVINAHQKQVLLHEMALKLS